MARGLSPCAFRSSNLIGSPPNSNRISVLSSSVVDFAFSCPVVEPRNGREILLLLALTDSARRIGLSGEVFLGVAFMGAVLRRVNFVLILESELLSELYCRENADGSRGDVAPCLGEFVLCNWNLDGFEGDRDNERRICLKEGKTSAW